MIAKVFPSCPQPADNLGTANLPGCFKRREEHCIDLNAGAGHLKEENGPGGLRRESRQTLEMEVGVEVEVPDDVLEKKKKT